MESIDEINGYFAADLMIEKIRDIAAELIELEDTVKVDDIQSRLKTVQEDAVRQLKDRQDLYVDGQNIIQLGRHKFSVNVQALDLTTVMHDGRHVREQPIVRNLVDDQDIITGVVGPQATPPGQQNRPTVGHPHG